MTHKSIQLSSLSLNLPHKTCFEDFSCIVHYGSKIAIIGKNGSGKTSLLKLLMESIRGIKIGYVPQIIDEFDNISGGQRFNKVLTSALKLEPDLLILDEPTNHLDSKNRKSLFSFLKNCSHSVIVVSHDAELLNNYIDIIWHIDNGKVTVFNGRYADYQRELYSKREQLEIQLGRLDLQKKQMHQALMQEQHRASKSKQKGEKSIEQSKWPTIHGKTKALRAQETNGNKKLAINNKKADILEQMEHLRLPEIIRPKFFIQAKSSNNSSILSIIDGSIGYKELVLNNINISLSAGDRAAILGNNGSGKTTLLKAILKESAVFRQGNWFVAEDIGYLDQHYQNLQLDKTVFDNIANITDNWSNAEIRSHLNDFLFRKNEEVSILTRYLSGGEKVRLSLCILAAKTPQLLLLDEITNNLDMETKQHVIEVLKEFPGGILTISHDRKFLEAINIRNYFEIINGCISG